MGLLEPLRVPRRAEKPAVGAARIPGRLRSLFAVPGWRRKPEPRVRYGQPFLPGHAALGRHQVSEARPLLEHAEAVRGRRFTYLGRTIGFPGRVDWDPRGIPEDWRVALNALDDIVPLGVAAALAPTPEVRRVWFEAASGLVREWIANAGRGVAGKVPALVRRIPNLIYAQVFFAPELRADPRLRRSFLESLYGQAAALAAAVPGRPADPSLVSAGRALFMAGRFFDGMEARGWLETGAVLLWAQLREQVQEDGGHAARNPAVHAAVLADYLEVLAILQASNDDVPIWARKRVKGMADFLGRLLHPDGEIPLFHGAGIGVTRPAHELLALAAVVLHEPGCAPPGPLGLWPLLLVGESGLRVHGNLPRRTAPPEARALRRTGFYVLPGAAGDLMLLDGAAPPPAGDAAAFGYELSVGGARVVVDAGMVGDEAPPWPAYFRSTRAHNVVAVGGADARVAEVSDVHWVVRDGLVYFGATHDGFAHLASQAAPGARLRHRRHVFCLPGRFWLVCDQVLGTGACDLESFIHFHPDVALKAACRGRVAFLAGRSDDAWLQVVPAGAHAVHVVHGLDASEGPPQGWYAARHGERRPASVLSLAAEARLPYVFGYALVPRSDAPVELRFEHDAFHLHATLQTGGEEYVLSVVQGDVEMVVKPV